MIDHDDRSIDDNPQRDGNSGQRIEVNLEVQQIVKDAGDKNVRRQSNRDDKQVTELPADDIDEQQQNQDRKHRTEYDFMQLVFDILRRVVGQRSGKALRESLLQFMHPLFDLIGEFDRIDVLIRGDRQVDRIQPVDSEIERRELFLVDHRSHIAQQNDPAVDILDRNRLEIDLLAAVTQEHRNLLRHTVMIQFRNVSYDILACHSRLYGGYKLVKFYAVRGQFIRIETDLHIIRRSPREFHLAHPLYQGQLLDNVLFGITLYLLRGNARIERIGQNRIDLLSRRGCRQGGIRDSLGQFRVEMPHLGSDFEPYRIDVYMLLKQNIHTAAPLICDRIDMRHTLYRHEQPFDFRGDLRLDHPSRCVVPTVVHADPLLFPGWRILYVQQRHDTRTDHHQHEYDQDNRERGYA